MLTADPKQIEEITYSSNNAYFEKHGETLNKNKKIIENSKYITTESLRPIEILPTKVVFVIGKESFEQKHTSFVKNIRLNLKIDYVIIRLDIGGQDIEYFKPSFYDTILKQYSCLKNYEQELNLPDDIISIIKSFNDYFYLPFPVFPLLSLHDIKIYIELKSKLQQDLVLLYDVYEHPENLCNKTSKQRFNLMFKKFILIEDTLVEKISKDLKRFRFWGYGLSDNLYVKFENPNGISKNFLSNIHLFFTYKNNEIEIDIIPKIIQNSPNEIIIHYNFLINHEHINYIHMVFDNLTKEDVNNTKLITLTEEFQILSFCSGYGSYDFYIYDK